MTPNRFRPRPAGKQSNVPKQILAKDRVLLSNLYIVDKGDNFRASGLCIELGDALVTKLNKPGEALTFYVRAAELRPNSSLSFLFSQEKVGKTHVIMADYHSALSVFTEIATKAEQNCKKPVTTSVYLDILAKCEIYRVLLLLLIQPTPQNVSPSLTSVLEKYAWETPFPIISSSDQSSQGGGSGISGAAFGANPSPGGIVGNQYLSEDVFLLLQSVVMAVQVPVLLTVTLIVTFQGMRFVPGWQDN